MAEPVAAPATAPAAAPPSAAPPSSPTSAPSPGGADSFSNLGSADDLDAVIEVPAESVAATTGAAATTEPPLATQPLEDKPPAAAAPPSQPPQEQPKGPQAAPTPAPAEVDNSPQGLVTQLAQHRDAVLNALAGDRFKLSDEEVKAIDTDAVGAIPRIMARTYYESMQSTLLHIQNLVPRLVLNVIRAQKQSDDLENAFYKQFGALDRTKHASDVDLFARMMRQSNPQITQQDLFAMVGAAVMGKHGLHAPAPGSGNGTGRPPQPAPFVPAPPGAQVKVIPEAESPWAGLGKDFED